MNPIAVYTLNSITYEKAIEVVESGYFNWDAQKLYIYAFREDEQGREPKFW